MNLGLHNMTGGDFLGPSNTMAKDTNWAPVVLKLKRFSKQWEIFVAFLCCRYLLALPWAVSLH